MTNPLITTIIPTFRRPQLLKRAITSVIRQTYPHILICVYDNASGDETKNIVQECMKQDSRISYHCHDQNIGMMENYKFALSQVNTPFFSILSDDDVQFPWLYEDTLQAIEKNSQCAFAFLTSIFMSPQGSVIDVPCSRWKKFGVLPPSDASPEMAKDSIAPQGALFQSWVLEKGLIDFSNQTVWDWDFLLQLAMRYPIHASQKPGAIFLVHPDSFTHSTKFAIWFQSIQKMISRVNLCSDFISKTSHDSIIHALNLTIRPTPRRIASKLDEINIQQAILELARYRKQYGLNFTTIMLMAVVKLREKCPPTRYLFSILKVIFATTRKISQSFNKSTSLQKTYGKYAKWLQNESS
jgi:hypothetical protein